MRYKCFMCMLKLGETDERNRYFSLEKYLVSFRCLSEFACLSRNFCIPLVTRQLALGKIMIYPHWNLSVWAMKSIGEPVDAINYQKSSNKTKLLLTKLLYLIFTECECFGSIVLLYSIDILLDYSALYFLYRNNFTSILFAKRIPLTELTAMSSPLYSGYSSIIFALYIPHYRNII